MLLPSLATTLIKLKGPEKSGKDVMIFRKDQNYTNFNNITY